MSTNINSQSGMYPASEIAKKNAVKEGYSIHVKVYEYKPASK